MFTYDFDRPDEWVSRFSGSIGKRRDALYDALRRKRDWDRLGVSESLDREPPDLSALDAALDAVVDDLETSAIRVFHATRLMDPDEISVRGLAALDGDAQAERVADALARSGHRDADRLAATARAWRESPGADDYSGRCGLAWFVTLRSRLHDGCLDGCFDIFGGEFMRDVVGPELAGIGLPYVVVARVPVRRWLGDASPDYRRGELCPVAMRILREVLLRTGCPLDPDDRPVFDIKVPGSVPPAEIEAVLDRHDPRVATPARP